MAVVDDPIKDRKDANSKTVRETLWDWWKDVLRTRLLTEASFILGVWTRWTEDDPAGRIMAAQAAGQSDEQVVMLRLPALAETEAERQSAAKAGLPVDEADPLGREPGEALWPEIENAEEHEATRRAYPVTFDSLYQGRPRPAGGYMVNETMFKTLPALPERNVRWVWATDWAISKKETSDYTVIGLIGLWEPAGQEGARLVIAYMERGRHNPHEARQMVKRIMLDHPQRLPLYSGQANMDKTHLFQMRHDPELLRYSIANLNRTELAGDKVTQATPWLEMTHAGSVYVVQGSWNRAFFDEVENFPHGAHDDQVDTVSVGVAALAMKIGGVDILPVAIYDIDSTHDLERVKT
jgi:predicted phage terminase large subunit-like protein